MHDVLAVGGFAVSVVCVAGLLWLAWKSFDA
jgi:hypothetical protein